MNVTVQSPSPSGDSSLSPGGHFSAAVSFSSAEDPVAPSSAPQFAPWATSSTPIMGHVLLWMFLDDVTIVISCVPSQTLPHPKSHLTRGRPPAVCDKDSPLSQLRFLSVRNEIPTISGTTLPLALCSGFKLPPAEPFEQHRQLLLAPGWLVLHASPSFCKLLWKLTPGSPGFTQ